MLYVIHIYYEDGTVRETEAQTWHINRAIDELMASDTTIMDVCFFPKEQE